jgi:hypothetical protein
MAIARDTGSAYPVSASANSGTVTAVTTATISATADTTLIVVSVGMSNANPTNWSPPTVAWASANASCTGFTSQVSYTSASSDKNASIWTSVCSGAFSNIAITVTAGGTGSTNAVMVVTVDALKGASTTVGASNGAAWSGSSTAPTTTVAGVATGSWIYVAAGAEAGASGTPVADTTEIIDQTNGSGPSFATTGVNTTGTSGNIPVGWSDSTTWGAVAALEVQVTTGAAATQTEISTASDAATGFNVEDARTFFQGNGFQENAFIVLAQVGGTDPNAKSATESETYAVTDSQDHKADLKPTLTAETFGVTDTVGRGAYSKSDESETSAASDSQDNGLGIKPSVSETFAVADSQGHKIDLKPGQSDTFGVTDSEGHKVDIKTDQSETSGATDSQATGVYVSKDESDTSTAIDAQAGTQGAVNDFANEQSDTSTAVDSDSQAIYRTADQSDSSAATDSEDRAVGVLNTITYPAQSESVASPVTFTGTATPPGTAVVELWNESVYAYKDTSGATDSEDSTVGQPLAYGLGILDTARASDSQAVSLAVIYASISETVGATDGHERQGYVEVPGEVFGIGIGAAQSDTVPASESLDEAIGVAVGPSGSQSDVSSATDSLAIALRRAVSESETTTGVDSVLSGVALKKALSETSGATDSLDVSVSLERYATLQDSAIATDAWAFTVEGDEISKFFSDTAIASDAMEAIRGSAALNQTFRVWSGSAWVYWDGGGWV